MTSVAETWITDIVEKMRHYATTWHKDGCPARETLCTCSHEANVGIFLMGGLQEIERLRAEAATGFAALEDEIERLRAELHKPITRRIKGDRYGISIAWDGFLISGLPKSIDEVQRILYIMQQLKREHSDIHARMEKRANQMLKLVNSRRHFSTDELEHIRREFPELFEEEFVCDDKPRDDGTTIAVGGEPGASAGKSE